MVNDTEEKYWVKVEYSGCDDTFAGVVIKIDCQIPQEDPDDLFWIGKFVNNFNTSFFKVCTDPGKTSIDLLIDKIKKLEALCLKKMT